ncbi:MAG: hypothetical protein HQL77_06855, partial [Magnetococcales bacterium]|nr:hypothetical protein [Magnetococcales bacterium]
ANPSVANRTVSFSVTDGNSNGEGTGALTTTATRDIVLQAINDAPGVATTGVPLSYTEGGTVAVDAGLSLADVDDTNMVGATVQITGNYLASEDILHFTNQAGITGSWNAVTGTLTLSGTASKADYQTALRSIAYQNTNNDNPSVANRTVSFSVTDGNSNGEGLGALTTTATRDIVVQASSDSTTNDALVDTDVASTVTTRAPAEHSQSDTIKIVSVDASIDTAANESVPVQALPAVEQMRPEPAPIMPESAANFASSGSARTPFRFSELHQSNQTLDDLQVLSRDLQKAVENDVAHWLEMEMITRHDVTTQLDTTEQSLQGKNIPESSSQTGLGDFQFANKNNETVLQKNEIKIGTTLRDDVSQFHLPPADRSNEKNAQGVPGYGMTEAKGDGQGMRGLTDQLNAFGPKAFHADVLELLRTPQKPQS